jgi:hypothetical protein
MREFNPHPEISLGKSKFDPKIHKTYYAHDYEAIFRDIAKGHVDPIRIYRQLILNDIWFILYFVFEIPDNKKPNHPFIVARCNDVFLGSQNYTLDIWAREFYKSTIKTIARKIQKILKNPEHAHAIFSHKSAVSKVFLFEIKQHFENKEMLKKCFPDVLWENPQRDAPIWSLDGGLVLKRKSNRREPNISSHGLTEGMPIGLHFEDMDFDDIVTHDIADSIDVMEKVKEKFDVALNLGTDGGSHTVTGTFYHFNDPLIYIRDKIDPITGKKKYILRLFPSTHDGSPGGKPIFNSEEREAELRITKSYRTQQLCDPVPIEFASLNPKYLDYVNEIPKGLYKFIIVDQAGDDDTNLTEGDDWAILTAGVKPVMSEVGISDIYLLDIFAEPLGESEGIDLIVQKYIEAGFTMLLGIEKAGLSSTHIHVQEALRKRGRYLTIENDIRKKRAAAIILLRPEKRNKKKFIDSAVEWPLKNGKIHVLDMIPARYREKLELEMKQHPFGKSDNILNTMAYLIKDIVLQYRFPTDLLDNELPERELEERYI